MTDKPSNIQGAMKALLIFIFLHLSTGGHTKEVYPRFLLSKNHNDSTIAVILQKNGEWKPYATYQEREKWTALSDEIKMALLKKGNDAVNYTWPGISATLYMDYSRNGQLNNHLNLFLEKREKLRDLVLAELVEGKGRFFDPIINGIWSISEETSWCLPSHLFLQHGGTTALPNIPEQVVDIYASDTGNLFAWIYYLLNEPFGEKYPIVLKRLKHEVKTRILQPNLERNDFWWMGFADPSSINNWTTWVTSNWLNCILLVEDNPELKAKATYKAMRCLDNFINIYTNDGGCDEGPGYWGHAPGSLFFALKTLKEATNGCIDISHEPLIANMGAYIYKAYAADGYFLCFADAVARFSPEYSMIYNYGKLVNDDMMIAFAKAHVGTFNEYRNSLWIDRNLLSVFSWEEFKKEETSIGFSLPTDVWMPDVQVYVSRDYNFDKGLYLAGKGGHNAESHNHNDVGSFIVFTNGDPVIIDAGVGTYTKKTFSENRYDIWTMQSQYHTLPTINGYLQHVGLEYRAKNVVYKQSSAQVSVSMDLADAYPDEAGIDFWKREILHHKRKSIDISETYQLDELKGDIFLNFLTPCTVTVTDGLIVMECKKSKTGISFGKEQLSCELEKIALDDKKLSDVWGSSLTRVALKLRDPKTKGRINYQIKELK